MYTLKEDHLKLPSTIKGWFNPQHHPDLLLEKFALSGEQKYLSALVKHYNQMIFHYLLSQSDYATAQDILQSTWLKVINKAHKYQKNTSSKSWLFTIARHTLIDELRRLKRWDFQEIEEQHLNSITLSKQMMISDNLARFNLAIEQLSFYQREAFIFQQEGFSLDEISQLCCEQQETIKSRLRYARNNIKGYLEKNS
jgi:RNA polymerase sigma-70 factor (ECF subfamily)